MGRPMAKNLLKAGHSLVVHSRSQGPVQELVKAGAKAAASPKDVAAQCDVLITMLPNSPEVELVALGPNGIIEGARRGLVFLDMSTISPIVSQKVGKALEAKGVRDARRAGVGRREGRHRRRALASWSAATRACSSRRCRSSRRWARRSRISDRWAWAGSPSWPTRSSSR